MIAPDQAVTDSTNAARQARYRARHNQPRQLEPCPSLAAYARHRRAGEPGDACGCHELYKADQRARDHQRRKGTKRARKEEA